MKFIVEINTRDFFKAGGADLDQKAVEKVIADATQHVTKLIEAKLRHREQDLASLRKQADQIITRLKAITDDVTVKVDVRHNEPFTISAPARAAPVTPSRVTVTPMDGLTKTQQAIVNSIGWIESLGMLAPSKTMVAFLADSSPKSSTFEKYVSQLRSAGYLSRTGFALTDEGRAIAQVPETPLSHDAMMAAIGTKLTPGQLSIVRATVQVYPDAIGKEDLAAGSGMSPNSSTFEKYVSQVKSLGLLEQTEPKVYVAGSVLFPDRRAA